MAKFTMTVSEAMKKALEEEMRRRKLDNIQETIRSIVTECLELKETKGE